MTVKRGDVVLVDYPFTTDQKRGRGSFTFPETHGTPRSGYSSRRGELFDEGLVVRCRHAEIEHIAETAGVARQERPRIQARVRGRRGSGKDRPRPAASTQGVHVPGHARAPHRVPALARHIRALRPARSHRASVPSRCSGSCARSRRSVRGSAHEPPVRHRSTATFREDP